MTDGRYPFCHTLKDPKLGISLALDIECKLDATVSLENGEPVVSVEAVYLNGENLWYGTTLSKMIAGEITEAAQCDDGLIAEVLAGEGCSYVGRGSNDPEGHWRVAS